MRIIKTAALQSDWWKKWPTHIQKAAQVLFKMYFPYATVVESTSSFGNSSFGKKPGKNNPDPTPRLIGGLWYPNPRFENAGRFRGNVCHMFLSAHKYEYTATIMLGVTPNLTGLLGQSITITRVHPVISLAQDDDDEQGRYKVIANIELGSQSTAYESINNIKIAIENDDPPNLPDEDDEDDEDDKPDEPKFPILPDPEDDEWEVPKNQKEKRQLVLAGYKDYTEEEIQATQQVILKAMEDGQMYSGEELFRHANHKIGARKRWVEIALSWLIAGGTITQKMLGMGYKYMLNSN